MLGRPMFCLYGVRIDVPDAFNNKLAYPKVYPALFYNFVAINN